MLKTTKKKMWTAANILNHVVRSKRRLCAAIALAVAWNSLRKPNQEAYENYFRTDIVSESKRLFSDFSDYKQDLPLTPNPLHDLELFQSGVPARPRSLAVFSLSVRGARREFEDQFRGLPIELVDLKNKFLATSYRYQGISRPPVQLVEVGGRKVSFKDWQNPLKIGDFHRIFKFWGCFKHEIWRGTISILVWVLWKVVLRLENALKVVKNV